MECDQGIERYPETIKNYKSSFFSNIASKLINVDTDYSVAKNDYYTIHWASTWYNKYKQ